MNALDLPVSVTRNKKKNSNKIVCAKINKKGKHILFIRDKVYEIKRKYYLFVYFFK